MNNIRIRVRFEDGPLMGCDAILDLVVLPARDNSLALAVPSDGHPGLGGYYVRKQSDDGDQWHTTDGAWSFIWQPR